MSHPSEESQALHSRGGWPRPINAEALEKLKLCIASNEGFPVDSENAFIRTSEAWVGMEGVLSNSHLFILHSFVEDECIDCWRIILIMKSNLFNVCTYKYYKEDMSDLEYEYDSHTRAI